MNEHALPSSVDGRLGGESKMAHIAAQHAGGPGSLSLPPTSLDGATNAKPAEMRINGRDHNGK